MKKRYFIVILVLILCIVLSAAVYAEEIPTSEERIVSPDARQVGSLTVYDFWLYKNSSNTTTYSQLETYINLSNNAFNHFFNVDFNCTANSASADLNEKAGCAFQNAACENSCGANILCASSHHKAAKYYLERLSTTYYKTLRYVDFPICYYYGVSSGHGLVNGLASANDLNIVISQYETGSSGSHVLRTTEHELSHWIGARDDVCTSEDEPCVMNSKGNYTGYWCTQCTNDINTYLDNNT